MSTTRNKQAVIVGFFVIIGILILVVAIFTLGGQKKTFSSAMNVTAIFNNVNGLTKGNNVWFSGVKIGTVKKIEFYGNSQVIVTLNIDKKAHEFIRKDTKAKIGAEGFIGNKLVVLYGGTEAAGAIVGGENLAVEGALNADDIMATLQTNNKNLVDITTDIKAVSKKLAAGEGTLGALLRDERLYKDLQGTVASLQRAANNSQQLTRGIADYTAQLHNKGTLAGDLVTDTMIMANLRTSVEQINVASAQTASLMHNLDNASEKLEENNNAAGLLLNDERVANELRGTMINLNTSSQKLDENLEALQHNFLLRGFFRKKAKREAKEAEQRAKDSAAVAKKQVQKF